MTRWEHRWYTAWLATASILSLVAVIVSAKVSANADKVAQHAAQLAEQADRRAIHDVIRDDKICSESNQGACQALINRLIRNASRKQAHRLACDLLANLDRASVHRIRVRSRCPIPLP